MPTAKIVAWTMCRRRATPATCSVETKIRMRKNDLIENKRISWIDIGKGIGIILVIAGHTFLDNWFYVWLNSFHMPFFFLLAGILCNPRSTKINLQKKIENFIIPFFLFVAFQALFWTLIDHKFHSFNIGPIWFLLGIFGVELFSQMILRITKGSVIENVDACVIVALCHAIMTIVSGNHVIIRPALIVLNGTTYYLIGTQLHALFCQKRIDKSLYTHRIELALCALLIGILSIWSSNHNGVINMYKNTSNNYALFYLNALLGSAFLIGISITLWKNKVLEFLGRNTVIILGTHNQVKLVLMVVLSRVTSIPVNILRNSWGGDGDCCLDSWN